MDRYRYSRSPAYARRQLARIEPQIAALRAQDCIGNWRRAADKARTLASLEAQQARWQAVLDPPPVERFRMPF